MAEDDSGEKTEEATSKRREEFRERGELARSQDLLSLLVLACELSYFVFFGDFLFHRLGRIFTLFFEARLGLETSINDMVRLGSLAFFEIGYMLFPLVVGIITFGILGNLVQIGVLITTKPLEPNLDKLNFFGNFIKTFFNKQAAGNIFFSIIKMFFILLVV